MKNILSLIGCLMVIFASAQTKKENKFINPVYSETSEIRVLQEGDTLINAFHEGYSTTAFLVNGKFINETSFMNIDPSQIESVNVEKGNNGKVIIEGKEYRGRVDIKMKPEFSPKYITLQKLAEKYLELDDNPIVFQINENVVNEDYTKYIVDEDFILKLIQSKVKTSNYNVEINVIKIITKTPENIKKANEIRLKGVPYGDDIIAN